MDITLESNQFKDNKICTLNYCRLYLQATTVADLTLADDATLDPQFLFVQHSLLNSETKYIEINQACPSKNAWRLWRKVNKIWSSQGILKQHLGEWLVSGTKLRQSWHMYYDQKNDTSMVKTAAGYTQYLRMSIKFLAFVDGHNIQWEISEDAPPTHEVSMDGGSSYIIPYVSTSKLEVITCRGNAANFAEYLQSLPYWERTLFEELDMKLDCDSRIQQFQDGVTKRSFKMGIVSDIAGKEQSVAFGWSIQDNNNTILADCAGPAFGSCQSSFCAEVYGMLSGV
eukprot:3026975-Ditylum_brightwellii.AAC.1